jgi:hypothetical protein
MLKTSKANIIYSFLLIIISQEYAFCNLIPPHFVAQIYITENINSPKIQSDDDTKHQLLCIDNKIYSSNIVEDSIEGLTTGALFCILSSRVQFYNQHKSDILFKKELLLINKSPPAFSWLLIRLVC